jgi:biotin carboxyl carrier protein
LGRICGGEDFQQRGSAEGKIAQILVAPGQQIDARDLLMRLE